MGDARSRSARLSDLQQDHTMANKHLTDAQRSELGRMINTIEAHRAALREIADKLGKMPRRKCTDVCAATEALSELQIADRALDTAGDLVHDYLNTEDGEMS
jgi:hypothetical protein